MTTILVLSPVTLETPSPTLTIARSPRGDELELHHAPSELSDGDRRDLAEIAVRVWFDGYASRILRLARAAKVRS